MSGGGVGLLEGGFGRRRAAVYGGRALSFGAENFILAFLYDWMLAMRGLSFSSFKEFIDL